MTDLRTEIVEAIGELDHEDLALVALLGHALKRKDTGLSAALAAYAHIPKQVQHDGDCEVDFDLVGRIKAVCPEDEGLFWARALIWCVMRGDQRKAAALHDLMQRRTAS